MEKSLESPSVKPTLIEKLQPVTKLMVLENSKDADGEPIVVRVTRLPKYKLGPMLKSVPSVVADSELDAEQRKAALAALSDEQKMERYLGMLSLASQVVIEAVVEPRLDAATIELIDEMDRFDIFNEVVGASGFAVTGKEAEDLARFRDGDSRRGAAGKPPRKKG